MARGAEDYYLHAGEAPGRWMGATAASLGLVGEVGDQQLVDLLAGRHPQTGEVLAQPQPGRERLPGYDLTFRAPKSVSLLFALGEGEVSREVKAGHDAAVRAAMGYLEREAAFTRRRSAGVIVPVRGEGFIAAAFQHRTSRAGDPLLHHHVLVANLVRSTDGRWGALDGRLIYTHAKTAGYLYQAELRAQLTRRLGLSWTPVVHGAAEIAGIGREVVRAFSRRRSEVLARLQERGEFSAKAAQVATLDTRRAKEYAVSPEGLLPQWRQRAAALGLTDDQLAAVVDSTGRRVVMTADDVAAAVDALLSPTGLTAHSSSFTRREVVRALCERLPAVGAQTVERLANAFLADRQVVPLAGERAPTSAAPVDVPDQRRFTTRELLATERALVDRSAQRNLNAERLLTVARRMGLSLKLNPAYAGGSAQVAPHHLAVALHTRPSISTEQRAMVERLVLGWDAVVVVRGHAGTGKTFALDACRQAWEAAGFRVVGCALSAQAAAELHAGSGITSTTVDRLLLELTRAQRPVLPVQESVLVVDEAGMVGTRLLQRLLDRAERAGAKAVLVGDDRQLPEIDAGGAFRGLCDRLGAVELTANLRQREEWERQALQLVRDGRPELALRAYLEHGRVVVGSSADAVRAQLIADWWAIEQRDPGGAVVIALRRADVRELNERTRALRVAAGAVQGPALELPTGPFAAGDRVVATRNARPLGVMNGSRGTVTDVDVHQRTMRIQLERRRAEEVDRLVTLPADYLDAGHLAHAYAITGHKAQGMTARRALVLGDEMVYREWGYVALSRGSEENRLYVVAGGRELVDDPGHRSGDPRSSADAIWELTESLRESRAQRLALDQLDVQSGTRPTSTPARLRDVAEQFDDSHLRAEVHATQGIINAPAPTPAVTAADRTKRIAELDDTLGRLTARRGRIEEDIATAQTRLAATSGIVARRRHREERARHEATIRCATSEIERLDRRQLPDVTERLEAARAEEARHQAWQQTRVDAQQWLAVLHGEARSRIERRARAAEAAPSAVLGCEGPRDVADRDTWRADIRAAEASRLWDGVEAQRPGGTPDPAVRVASRRRIPPDVADMLESLREPEAAEHERTRRARERSQHRSPHAATHRPRHFGHGAHRAPQRDGPYMTP